MRLSAQSAQHSFGHTQRAFSFTLAAFSCFLCYSCFPKSQPGASTQKTSDMVSVRQTDSGELNISCAKFFTIEGQEIEAKWIENYKDHTKFQAAVTNEFVCERLRLLEPKKIVCAAETEATLEVDYVETATEYKTTKEVLEIATSGKICENAPSVETPISTNTEDRPPSTGSTNSGVPSATGGTSISTAPSSSSGSLFPTGPNPTTTSTTVSETEMEKKIRASVVPTVFTLSSTHTQDTWFKKTTEQSSHASNAGANKCQLKPGDNFAVGNKPVLQADKKHVQVRIAKLKEGCEFVSGFLYGPHFANWPSSVKANMAPN